MKIHQLMYFLETAKHEHIGRAAKILAISPSAISHSIAALEEELGRQLFAKQGKNITLTNHGKLLLERVSKLITQIDQIKEEIISDQVELQGTYKLAGSHLLCPTLLAPAWIRLQKVNPKLLGELYTLRSSQVLQSVGSGEFDIGLCFNPQSHPSVQIRTIYEGELVPSIRKNHPLLKVKVSERVARLSDHSATLPKAYQGIDNCETHPVFEKFGIVPKVDLIFDNYEIAVQKVKLSDSWAFLPDWIARREGLQVIVPSGWHAPVNISVLWPSNRILTKVLQNLIRELEASLALENPKSPSQNP